MSKLKGKILIIDDDKDVLYTANLALKQKFTNVITESDPNRIPKLVQAEKPDVIFLDMNFAHGATSGNEGLYWLKEIIKIDPLAHVVMNTAYGDINIAVDAMKLGALDFLIKPWEKEKLMSTAINVFHLRRSRSEIKELKNKQKLLNKEYGQTSGELIFESNKMQDILSTVQKVAKTDASVLILGENGTGKEVIARQIQLLSDRSDEPFIKVDLGALPESLFESELFGHEKGAFTDAKTEKAGKFEVANGGTIFLDEIGNIPTHLQVKLLSVLQNREVTRIGGNTPISIDVRLISATNSPLKELLNSGGFREDLLYRINTIELTIPTLSERKSDIMPIANYYLKVYSDKYKKAAASFSDDAQKKLMEYLWPGNIRELQHTIERAIILTDSNVLTAEHIAHITPQLPNLTDAPTELSNWEKNAIINAINENEGNLSKAADALGMGRTTLYRKIKKYNI